MRIWLTRRAGFRRTIVATLVPLALGPACRPATPTLVTLDTYPLDIARTYEGSGPVAMDPVVSWDGHGSLRVHADSPIVVPIIDLPALRIDDTTIIYEAKIRTRDLDGLAYLEVRANLTGRGEYFSRGLRQPATGSQGWTSHQVKFHLKKGEVPSALRLSLVLTGPGTAWVDDVRLLRVVEG